MFETLKEHHKQPGWLDPRPLRDQIRGGVSIMCLTAPSLDKKLKLLTVLDELMTERRRPRYTCSHNGPEFIAKAFNRGSTKRLSSDKFLAGIPREKGFDESFQGKLRDEC